MSGETPVDEQAMASPAGPQVQAPVDAEGYQPAATEEVSALAERQPSNNAPRSRPQSAMSHCEAPQGPDGMMGFVRLQLTEMLQPFAEHVEELHNRVFSLAEGITELRGRMDTVEGQLPEHVKTMEGLRADVDETVPQFRTIKIDFEALSAESKDTQAKANKIQAIAQATLDKLDARLDKAEAKSAELSERMAELSDEIAAIDKSVAEATKIREEQKATFTKANADFKEAADAVSDAIDVLKDFYEGGNAFIQVSAVTSHKNKDDPWKRMFGTSLRAAEDQPEEIVGVDPEEAGDGVGAVAIPKMGGPSASKGGIIIGMMETMAGEFEKTVAELQATEDTQAKEYAELMQDNKVSKVSKEMEIKGSKSELSFLDVRIGESTEDKKLATKELAAIEAYLLKLKPTCEGRVVSFAERQAKREAEIAGCKEALEILEDTTDQIGLVQVSTRHNLRKH